MNAVLRGIPALCLFLTACTTMPVAPGVMALPGSGKSLDQFRTDDVRCQQYARTQAVASPAAKSRQDHYDTFYIQCMYASGHKVPVYGKFAGSSVSASRAGQPAPPQPPTGSPPPPPPR
jgi:hypothetical protein